MPTETANKNTFIKVDKKNDRNKKITKNTTKNPTVKKNRRPKSSGGIARLAGVVGAAVGDDGCFIDVV
jgi:hypothetical protein